MSTVMIPQKKAVRRTRAEKTKATRAAILDAAMVLVGEDGCAELSIVSITQRANVALGTFYMHFPSKQALLNELLPWAGSRAHEMMDAAASKATSYAEYERLNFDALTKFQRANPFYFRLLSESEIVAPEAYQAHITNSIARYERALREAFAAGELAGFDPGEFEALATMLVSIKLLLFLRLGPGTATEKCLAGVRDTYLTFVLNGLLRGDGTKIRAEKRESRAKA